MPTYRSITVSMTSQLGVLTIPEFPPPRNQDDPFSTDIQLCDPGKSLVSVFIPTYPGSQFWISYSVSAPHPPNALYYFKFLVDGKHVVSWGCGEKNDFRGQTMYALFDGGSSSKGKKHIERRLLSYAGEAPASEKIITGGLCDTMEVRVYRSRGRKRIKPEVETFDISALREDVTHRRREVSLKDAGLLPAEMPKRFYKYRLLDPLDKPFAIFRYYLRSYAELTEMGVISPTPSATAPPSPSLPPLERSSQPSLYSTPPHNLSTISLPLGLNLSPFSIDSPSSPVALSSPSTVDTTSPLRLPERMAEYLRFPLSTNFPPTSSPSKPSERRAHSLSPVKSPRHEEAGPPTPPHHRHSRQTSRIINRPPTPMYDPQSPAQTPGELLNHAWTKADFVASITDIMHSSSPLASANASFRRDEVRPRGSSANSVAVKEEEAEEEDEVLDMKIPGPKSSPQKRMNSKGSMEVLKGVIGSAIRRRERKGDGEKEKEKARERMREKDMVGWYER